MHGRFDRTLAARFGFDEADLAANRMMQMSPRQRQREQLGAAATRSHLPKVLMVLAVGAVVTVVFIAVQQQGDSRQLLLGAGALAVAVALVGVFAVVKSRRTAARLEQGAAVEVMDGPVYVRSPKFSLAADSQHYGYREVGVDDDVAILLDPEDAAVFHEGERYRIYFADQWGNGSRSILSVERFG